MNDEHDSRDDEPEAEESRRKVVERAGEAALLAEAALAESWLDPGEDEAWEDL